MQWLHTVSCIHTGIKPAVQSDTLHKYSFLHTETLTLFRKWTSSPAWPVSICKVVQVVHTNNLICNKTLVLFLVRLYSLIKITKRKCNQQDHTSPPDHSPPQWMFCNNGALSAQLPQLHAHRTLVLPYSTQANTPTLKTSHYTLSACKFPFQPKSTQPKAFAKTKSFSYMSSGKLTLHSNLLEAQFCLKHY